MNLSSTIDNDDFLKKYKLKRKIFIDVVYLLNKDITIGTLGPNTTTSHSSFKYFEKYLKSLFDDIKVDCKLFNNFDLVYEALLGKEVDMIILPNAYDKMTEFYWDSKLFMISNYYLDTPRYGMASLCDMELDKKDNISIVTCKPVKHLVNHLLSSIPNIKNKKYEIIDSVSTASSLSLIIEGKADMAITNSTSLERSNAVFISDTISVEVLWSVFIRKELINNN